MRTLYLDAMHQAHITAGDGLMPWNDADGLFNGKCNAYVEGFRIVPEGATWTRADGTVFRGLMIAPAVPFEQLQEAQAAYEQTNQSEGGTEA